MSSVPIYYATKSDIRVKSYDPLNFSRASVVQFRASRYIMRLNWTSEWKVMTISISRELTLFYFERLDMWCAWIGPLSEKLWPFQFLKSFCCSISSVSICDLPESNIRVKSYDNFYFSRASIVQFRASLYVMRLKRTSEWKVMTILISRELPLFNFEYLYMWCAESDLRLKSYDHLTFSRASIVHFRASWYIMYLNLTSVWKVMTIWISRELSLCNFEHLYMWCAWIGPPSEK